MVTLGAEVLEVGQAIEAELLQLTKGNLPITVLVHQGEHSVDNVIGLLLVLHFVLLDVNGDVVGAGGSKRRTFDFFWE